MTIPISFFKKSDELERINNLHTGPRKLKVVVVTTDKDDSSQYESLFRNLRGLDGLEKQTD